VAHRLRGSCAQFWMARKDRGVIHGKYGAAVRKSELGEL
jgi:hypothetical protein